jgi:hypothetical protein
MKTENLINKLIDEGPKKPLPHPLKQTFYWLIGIVIYLILFATYNGFRSDITEKLREIPYVIEIILLFGIGTSSALTTLCLSRPDGHQMPWLKLVPFGFILLGVIAAFIGSTAEISVHNFAHSMTLKQFNCPMDIILFSALPGMALFFIVRIGITIQCCWAGTMATLSVTSFGYLLMRLIEPIDNPAHLIVWHVMPIIMICILGMMIGKLVFKWR